MTQEAATGGGRLQFGLRQVLYALAVFAASMGLCGTGGIAVALVVVSVWWGMFSLKNASQRRAARNQRRSAEATGTSDGDRARQETEAGRGEFTLIELLVVVAIIALFLALLAPISSPPNTWCRRCLRRVSGALFQYQRAHGSMPPAYVVDSDGKPLHSWRVLILPELGYQNLFDQYDFSQPWDGPQNRALLERMPPEYHCPVAGPRARGETSYLAVTGRSTAWPGATPRAAEDVENEDALILVVEAEFQPVPWTKPQDLSIDDASRLLAIPDDDACGHWWKRFLTSTFQGRHAIWADGDCRWIPPCDAAELQELLIVDDGRPKEPADPSYEFFAGAGHSGARQFHYGNIARLAIFIVVAIWPVLRMRPFIRKHSQPQKPEV